MLIRRETFAAVLPATTADDTRYYLDGVNVEPSNHRLVATNGHVLLIATDKRPIDDADFPCVAGAEYHGDPESAVMLPTDAIKAVLQAMPKKTVIPVLATAQLSKNGSDKTLTLTATDLQAPRIATIRTDERSTTFPKYERVLPKDRPEVTVFLMLDVLEALIKSAKAVGSKTIRFDVPIGRNDREKGIATVNEETGETTIGKPGCVTSAVNVKMNGENVLVSGCAMPCRI